MKTGAVGSLGRPYSNVLAEGAELNTFMETVHEVCHNDTNNVHQWMHLVKTVLTTHSMVL